jgi:hypothetical protein
MPGCLDPHCLRAEEKVPGKTGYGAIILSRRHLRLWIAKKQDAMEILPNDSALD